MTVRVMPDFNPGAGLLTAAKMIKGKLAYSKIRRPLGHVATGVVIEAKRPSALERFGPHSLHEDHRP